VKTGWMRSRKKRPELKMLKFAQNSCFLFLG
jgi:hypothetical protein